MSINRRYEIEVRDAATGQNIMTLGGDSDRASNSTTALSPGGDWLAEANRAVALWNMLRASLSITLPETRNSVWSQALMPQKNRLAVGTSDGELVIWDLDRVRSRLAELDLDR